MTRPLFIDGDRVSLRVSKAEEPALREGHNHPSVRRYISIFRTPVNESETTIASNDGPSPSTIIIPKSDQFGDEPVGSVSLAPIKQIDGYGNLGIWLHPDAWGNGFALDACAHMIEYGFRELALHRISATVMAPNERSKRLIERLGFTHEGTAREAQFADGRYVDVERYGLLVGEWNGPESVLRKVSTDNRVP